MSVLESHVSGVVIEVSKTAISIKTSNNNTIHTFSNLDEVFSGLNQVVRMGQVIGLYEGKFDYKVTRYRG